MALIGNLKDLKLPSLIQLNCMEKNHAKLTIERGGKYGFLYFEGGQITHAEYDPYIGEEAVHKMLTLIEGRFKVESDVKPPVRTIHTNWSNLLLEGMHKIDHAQDEPESQYLKLFERLMTLRGVKSAAFFDKEGTCIDKTNNSVDNAGTPNVAFTMLQALKIGKTTGFGNPKFVNILKDEIRYFIIFFKEHYIVLDIDIKMKSDTLLPLVSQAIK